MAASLNSVDYEPRNDWVLLREIPKGETAGGLALPDNVQLDPPKGVAVKVGPGKRNEFNGDRVPPDTTVGQVVIIGGPYLAPIPISLGGDKYILVRDRDILLERTV